MLWTYLLILSVVQGVTEFLPISSSAHLILVRDLFAALGLPMWEGSQADELDSSNYPSSMNVLRP